MLNYSRSWSNVAGFVSVELYSHNGDLYCAHTDERTLDDIAVVVGELAEDDAVELIIEFVSSGYHESASMYGGPDNLGWEENGSEDRELSRVYLDGDYPELSKKLQKAIFDFYLDRVELEELE